MITGKMVGHILLDSNDVLHSTNNWTTRANLHVDGLRNRSMHVRRSHMLHEVTWPVTCLPREASIGSQQSAYNDYINVINQKRGARAVAKQMSRSSCFLNHKFGKKLNESWRIAFWYTIVVWEGYWTFPHQ